MSKEMIFRNRRFIKPEDLNPRGTLFGGQLLRWIDEEAAIFVACQLETDDIVTKLISEVNFISPALQRDIVEIGCEVVEFGRTSITIRCVARNKTTRKNLVEIDKIVFVCIDAEGKPTPHGVTEVKE